jgi:prepilin-type N-terminal cleavage/methylation domain-containing protein
MNLSKIKKGGFSLIELLVVISIIGLITTIALTNFAEIRKKGQNAAQLAHVNQYQTALELFFQDHGYYPGTELNKTYCLGNNCVYEGNPIAGSENLAFNTSASMGLADTNPKSQVAAVDVITEYVSSIPESPVKVTYGDHEYQGVFYECLTLERKDGAPIGCKEAIIQIPVYGTKCNGIESSAKDVGTQTALCFVQAGYIEEATTESGGPGPTGPARCQNSEATNYGEEGECIMPATCDTEGALNRGQAGACQFPPERCDNDQATNYGQEGECEFAQSNICNDPNASNYGSEGECVINQQPTTCTTEGATNYGQEGECVFPINVCDNPEASNYGQEGLCVLPPSVCDQPSASNYGQQGECIYPEPTTCQNTEATNYGQEGACEFAPPPICDNTDATNYGQEGECMFSDPTPEPTPDPTPPPDCTEEGSC